mmetsp:Transcript_44218/g.96466  ORF Transcript_44218/g.96466 Transcript_44218/m.96466 type:complete len:362 (+) Transcript_44218:92-1177(+)|eukprot:4424226-Pleurochrysis_carterae.AAC.3
MGEGANASSPAPKCVLRGHSAEVTVVKFWGCQQEAGTLSLAAQQVPSLFSGSADGQLYLWNMRTHRVAAKVCAHANTSVQSIHPILGHQLVTHGRDGFIRIWDLKEKFSVPLLEMSCGSHAFCSCDVQPHEIVDSSDEGPLMIACTTGDAQHVVIWDARQQQVAQHLEASTEVGPHGMCMCIRYSSAHHLLAGWEDGSAEMFDLRRGQSMDRRRLHKEPLLCLDVDPKKQFLITGAADCLLCLVPLKQTDISIESATSVDTGQDNLLGDPVTAQIPVTNESSGSGGISSVTIRPDRKVFATAGWDRRVRIWQRRSLKPLAVLRHHTSTVNAVQFSRCSRWLASASGDGTVAIWGLYPPNDR